MGIFSVHVCVGEEGQYFFFVKIWVYEIVNALKQVFYVRTE